MKRFKPLEEPQMKKWFVIFTTNLFKPSYRSHLIPLLFRPKKRVVTAHPLLLSSAMKLKSLLALTAVTLGISSVAHAKMITKNVDYKQGGAILQGYLAYDDSFKGKRPGVLIAHQWLGLTDYEKGRARMLAGMGYVAFALDIYGKGKRPKNTTEAGKLSGSYKANRPLWRNRARAAVIELRKQPNVDVNKLAIIGYCFGGGTALELARSGADLKGFVTFHGSLDTPTPADAKNIKGKVLVLHGADDPFSPMKDVMALMAEMKAAKVNYEVDLYGDTVHSFTEKDAGSLKMDGAAYNAQSDARSWARMKGFFAEIF